MRIISWNVNGLRSNIVDFNTSKNKNLRKIVDDSPLDQLIKKYDPDMICFQETRMGPDQYHLFQSEEIKKIFPFQYWSSSQGEGGRSGNRYSGTSIWSRIEPISVQYDIPQMEDREGRIVQLDFGETIVIGTYTPNTGSNWDYRLNHWEPVLQTYLSNLSSSGRKVVYCGDFNIANKCDVWFGDLLEKKFQEETDPTLKKKYARKVASKKRLHSGEEVMAGYSLQERNAYKVLLENSKMIDCFRTKHPNVVDQFSWFNMRIRGSFTNNLGWLIDRFIVPRAFENDIKTCEIAHFIGVRNRDGNMISDHIPIFLEI